MSKIIIGNCKAKIVRESDTDTINMCFETKCPFWKDDSTGENFCSLTEFVDYGCEITIDIKKIIQPSFKKVVVER